MDNTWKDLLPQAKKAKSPAELVELAKANDIFLSLDQAEAFFKKSESLSDDELANISGGCSLLSKPNPNPEGLKIGDRVYDEINRHFCSCNVNEYIIEDLLLDNDPPLVKLRCVKCQTSMFRQLAGHHVKK